jgi:hypothetical protein
MKTPVYTRIMVVGLFLLASAVVGLAQSRTSFEVKIPFDFIAGNTKMPAGAYVVSRISQDNAKVILLRCSSTKAVAIVLTESIYPRIGNQRSRLEFTRYGDTAFLRQIWTGDDRAGRALLEGRAERELARANPIAKSGTPPEQVSVSVSTR